MSQTTILGPASPDWPSREHSYTSTNKLSVGIVLSRRYNCQTALLLLLLLNPPTSMTKHAGICHPFTLQTGTDAYGIPLYH